LKIFQFWSSALFDLHPWIIIQIPIFENTQKSGLKSFMFPFEFILVSSQIIQNQFSYSFPNSAQPAQATSTQPSRCLASFPSRPAYLPSPPLGPPSPSLGLGLPASPNRHHSGPLGRSAQLGHSLFSFLRSKAKPLSLGRAPPPFLVASHRFLATHLPLSAPLPSGRCLHYSPASSPPLPETGEVKQPTATGCFPCRTTSSPRARSYIKAL
jgi:hypothetical protein